MIKRNVFLILAVFLIDFIMAQDQLFKRDNSSLKVKILEINPNEVKYKLYSNLTGPTYFESTNNVVMILYENGKTEIIQSNKPATEQTAYEVEHKISLKDSLKYYGYSNNISLNFLNFFNSEVGLVYQKEFFSSNFNLVIPMAVGVEVPYFTQSVWFGQGTGNAVDLTKKNFEIGLGINYYPDLGSNFNYFIGPVFRFMQFDCKQNYSYNASNVYPYNYHTISKNSVLNRYSMTITNGVVFRTKSRLTSTLFVSLGFKNDQILDPIVDPITNKPVNSVYKPISLNIWMGYNVGFNF